MMSARETQALRGELLLSEPLAGHTSWRVGGPVDRYFKPADREDLAAFLATLPADEALLWLGLGSNLLVRDGGFRGSVIATHRAFADIERRGECDVYVEAGVPCAKIAKRCAGWGIGPASFFAGVPGTLGGALAMNAGAFGGETWPHVVEVETIDRQGRLRQRPAADFDFGYRRVTLPGEEWFLSALLRFAPGAEGSDDIRDLLRRRKASQPIGLPSCGSVFTNPPGDHAARLIEAAGLKGLRVGGAQVSPKHANFIINTGAATAADTEALMRLVQSVVEERHGVRLQPEVRIVGEPQ